MGAEEARSGPSGNGNGDEPPVPVRANSMVGARSGLPLVQLVIGDRKPLTLSVQSAREVAAMLYDCAAAAEMDHALIGLLRTRMDCDEQQAADFVAMLRSYRTDHPPPSSP